MRRRSHPWRVAAGHVAAGATVGLLVLHPVTMVIYWFELHPSLPGVATAWQFALYRVTAAFQPEMLPMTVAFAILGALLGLGSGLYALALRRRQSQVSRLSRLLDRDLGSLLAAGEGERLELKASARWDYRKGAGNRELEAVIVRSIAGFLNAEGGTLLIGVADDGEVLGLERDFETLRSKGRDGFERFLLDQVAQRLGADTCPLVHVLFHRVGDRDICRVTVEPAPRPVFLRDGGGSHLFVRTGNATRELDAEEALRHVAARGRAA